MKKLLSLVALSFLCSCGSSGDATDECSDIGLPSRILSGTECGDVSRSSVVRIELYDDGDELGVCSGTVIAPTKILTAAHCVIDDVDEARIEVGGKTIKSIRLAAHPDAEVDDEEITSPDRDVAVITLEEPTDISPLPIFIGTDIQRGDEFSIFGYGLSENDEDELRSGRMEIEDIEDEYFNSEFDGDTSGACFGDSGGPGIVSINPGGNYSPGVVGVISAIGSPGLFPRPPFPFLNGLPFPFPLPLPFGNNTSYCERGAVTYLANLQIQAVIDFIAAEAPGAVFR